MAFVLPLVRFAGFRLVGHSFSPVIPGQGTLRAVGLGFSNQNRAFTFGALIEGREIVRGYFSYNRLLASGKARAHRLIFRRRYSEIVRRALGGGDGTTGKVNIGLKGLNGMIQKSLKNAANNYRVTAKVDTSNYDKAIRDYMSVTRKSAIEVVNQKAFFIAVGALKETYKANKTDIKNEMGKPADKMRGLTVAEALVVYRSNKQGKKLTRGEIRKEARALTNKRTRAIGFLKSGWLPAIRVLSPYVQRRASVGGQAKQNGKDKGGAKPAARTSFSTNVVASIWNNIQADNNPKARNYMQIGLQKAIDAEAKSMMAYVEAKMRKNAERFNRA